MLRKDNFHSALAALGYAAKDGVWGKTISGAIMQVDFGEERLTYPSGVTIEGEFTTNFTSPENFVVFECVDRLLTLGYKPEHLTLEPKWKVGHGASGGRADVVVKDNDGAVFAIIECKTAGREFEDAWSESLEHPSQLFSYAQQEGSTQIVCLYASNWNGDEVVRDYYVIPVQDNAALLRTVDEDGIAATYAKAGTAAQKFKAWKETYGGEASTQGLFESNSQPFQFGKQNYSAADLKELAHADIQKKYHQFATILRKYNVSGRENAFDKLVNLFLCKVVDEQQNPTALKFYWRGLAYDTHFDLQDRLQSLYQQGMKQFLGEDVTYITQEAIDNAFRFLEKGDEDATRDTINQYFKALKFFKNNDFGFIDVHNEKLFYQNARILLAIVEMLQDIRLKSDSDDHSNQFLGDMFEGFLDAGVKQSEGQFFTPMPIVKFIMASLPLEEIVAGSDGPPQAVDYACGAGHFLTELARQLRPLVEKYKGEGVDIRDYYRAITGVEKEYRLSKVAKVSTFMYGQDDIRVIHADALGAATDVRAGSHQILVANPPYSVKGFLETLTPAERRTYELYGPLDEKSLRTNNAIETFFIERAKQLLAPGGVAAIILPSSILSNDARQYVQTRSLLLQHFHIIAIAELGSGTFGKTGTNTVTLFLRRRAEDPTAARHFLNRADDWIHGDVSAQSKKNKRYGDLHLLEGYCAHVGLPFDHYREFLHSGTPDEVLTTTDIWQDYSKAYLASAEVREQRKKRGFKALSEAEQDAQLLEGLYRRVREVEKDKLHHFLLAQSNGGPVLIIRSPTGTKAIKKFLGYNWSQAKGKEGIKYLAGQASKDDDDDEVDEKTGQLKSFDDKESARILSNLSSLANISTFLYNPSQKEDRAKLNYHILEAFRGKPLALPEELGDVAWTARLEDMLDFGRKDFGKAIGLAAKEKAAPIATKYPLEKLGNVITLSYGSPLPEAQRKAGTFPVVGSNGIVGEHNSAIVKGPGIVVGRKGSAGKLTWIDGDFFPIDTTFYVEILDKGKLSMDYAFLALGLLNFEGKVGGTGVPGLAREDAYSLGLPIPPPDVQQSIITECRVVDEKVEAARADIEAARAEIEQKVQATFNGVHPQPLSSIATFNPSKSELRDLDGDMLVSFVEMASVSNEGFIENKEDRPLKSVRQGSYTYFADEDVIVAKITPCMENGKCALAKGLTNSIGMGSSEFHVVRTRGTVLPAYIFHHLNRAVVRADAEKDFTGASGHRRVPISFYENLRIPVPSPEAQQKLVDEISALEAQIAAARLAIEAAPAEKAVVLKKWLE